MCVFNEEDEFNGIKSDFRCGMCDECSQEYINERNKEKARTTSCGNCGWCEECCN